MAGIYYNYKGWLMMRSAKRETDASEGNRMGGMRGKEGYTDKMDGGKRPKIGDRLRDEE